MILSGKKVNGSTPEVSASAADESPAADESTGASPTSPDIGTGSGTGTGSDTKELYYYFSKYPTINAHWQRRLPYAKSPMATFLVQIPINDKSISIMTPSLLQLSRTPFSDITSIKVWNNDIENIQSKDSQLTDEEKLIATNIEDRLLNRTNLRSATAAGEIGEIINSLVCY